MNIHTNVSYITRSPIHPHPQRQVGERSLGYDAGSCKNCNHPYLGCGSWCLRVSFGLPLNPRIG